MTYTPDSLRRNSSPSASELDAHADAWEADVCDKNLYRTDRDAEQHLRVKAEADNAALRERLEAAMVLLTENVVAEWERGDCCTYCGGIATYMAKGDGSPGTWNVNHRQDCRYIALASQQKESET